MPIHNRHSSKVPLTMGPMLIVDHHILMTYTLYFSSLSPLRYLFNGYLQHQSYTEQHITNYLTCHQHSSISISPWMLRHTQRDTTRIRSILGAARVLLTHSSNTSLFHFFSNTYSRSSFVLTLPLHVAASLPPHQL